MTDVVNPKSASPDQLLPYHKKISAEGKALMKCFISYTYMVLKRAPTYKSETPTAISGQAIHRTAGAIKFCR